MAHFKCAPCRSRVWRDDDAGAQTVVLCPQCGGPLEAVQRAEELIGLRALRPHGPGEPRSIAEHVRDAIARNDAARARAGAPPADAV